MLKAKHFRNGRSFRAATLGCVAVGFLVLLAGCPSVTPTPTPDACAGVACDDGFSCDATTGECVADASDGFADASAARGGSLYDKWWAVDGVTADQPTDDHAFWSMQTTNERTGSDTWRCKECHGWDYKGAAGVYAAGSHMTGFAGIFGTTMTSMEVFNLLGDDHGYQGAGLSDADLWDLTKFVLEGQIDTDEIIDTAGAFNGEAGSGQTIYASTCQSCHGDDGLMIPPSADDDHDEWIGKLANENPWEYQHKMRFGQPGTSIMPPQFDVLTNGLVSDLGSFSQTLPEEVAGTPSDSGPTGDADAGQAFYSANGCAVCHGDAAEGGALLDAPSLVGVAAEEVLERNSGAVEHPGGAVDGITQQDADDVAVWLASL